MNESTNLNTLPNQKWNWSMSLHDFSKNPSVIQREINETLWNKVVDLLVSETPL